MKTFEVEVLNPKAESILAAMAELNLITITSDDAEGLKRLLKRLRSGKAKVPSLKQITKEVEEVRAARYAHKR